MGKSFKYVLLGLVSLLALFITGILCVDWLRDGCRREMADAHILKTDLNDLYQYDTIPLRKRIGRMLIVGLDSCAIKKDDPVIEKISDYGVGGVILFGYNVPADDSGATSYEKLRELCGDLQGLSDYGLLIGIDQEGGKVIRLKGGNGYVVMPSHSSLGETDNEDTTRFYAGETARILSESGINLNYAPCADMNVNPSCPVIGKLGRAFSADGAEVARHAGYFIDEHRKAGVLTAVKHFPGHGSSVSDSHNGLTDISNTWTPDELAPFKSLIDRDLCDMVMVGHLFNSQIDSLYPASLSRKTVLGLLRDSLGWDGLVVSDDMGMKAISSNYTLEESLELCINAGVDMIMLIANGTPQRLEQAVSLIEGMVIDGRIPERRINEAYRRIVQISLSL